MTADVPDPVHAALIAYADAVAAKDVEAFIRLYAPDIHVFDLWGAPWWLEGTVDWRQMATEWFASLGEERLRVDIDDLRSTMSDELAVGHAFVRFTAFDVTGRALRALTSRVTLALRHAQGRWWIFHEHSSAPIDHDSGRAILQRADA